MTEIVQMFMSVSGYFHCVAVNAASLTASVDIVLFKLSSFCHLLGSISRNIRPRRQFQHKKQKQPPTRLKRRPF